VSEPNYPGALRLVFEREGDEVRLVEAIPVDMVVPPGDDFEVDDTERAGFAVRVYGGDGELVYRRSMADPLALEAEIYTGDPEQPFERHPVSLDFVQFEIVVPNVETDVEVELLASPPRRGPDRAAARPVTRVPVRAADKKPKGGPKGGGGPA
jgi:hypothetical protein